MVTLEFKKRKWENAFNGWMNSGAVEIGEKDYNPLYPRPGPHPYDDHLWNNDPQQHIDNE